ncbi:hypothetical protein SLE2022_190400 [Rubroshorea leprosula]
MGAVVGTSILLFLQFFSLVHGTFARGPPPDIWPKVLLKYLSLGDKTTIYVPALYVFGDATVDAGNSPHLNPKKKGELIPFGQNLPGIPKGRVTNGRTIVDFIAQLVGLPFPPPALGMSDAEKQNTKTGINYASQSSSINSYVPPGVEASVGKSLCFDQQIGLFENTIQDLKTQFRSNEDYSQYMSKSLFFINIGSDDFALAWDMEFSRNNTPDAYARSISNMTLRQLRRLYRLGARKFVVNNVPPLGCQPFNLYRKHVTTGCVEDINELVSTYNKLLADLLGKLQSTLPESKFVLADAYKVFEDAIAFPKSYGFTTAKDACCSAPIPEPSMLVCNASTPVCEEQNARLYFDPSHPSERMHFVWASRLLIDSSVCSPLNLLQLMQA